LPPAPQTLPPQGPAPQNLALFGDAHGFLHGVNGEVETLKRQVQQVDDLRRGEVEELRRELEQERFERRDALNKLRYEFEEFVHRKIDKILNEVEEIKSNEKRDDTQQQEQIDFLVCDIDRIKENLYTVQTSWGKLVSNCLNPSEATMAAKRLEARRAEAQALQTTERDLAASGLRLRAESNHLQPTTPRTKSAQPTTPRKGR